MACFNGDNGLSAFGPLARDTDGSFYGTTFSGGVYGSGNIYQLSFASTPAAEIRIIVRSGASVTLTASGLAGRTYPWLGTTNLSHPVWLPVGNAVTTSNTIFTATDNLPASNQKFYQLEFETP